MKTKERAIVTKRSGDKTVSVKIRIQKEHGVYGKIIRAYKNLQVHDEFNLFQPGDAVWVTKCKPRSKTKTWEAIFDSEPK
ncbi:30S ribosomal subunit protein S17 [Candidatus Tremblaya phenacola PAVE]|nr:30S ribosomal subunit protein S17 [Candidatus Tremblaya phenacola PAVE]